MFTSPADRDQSDHLDDRIRMHDISGKRRLSTHVFVPKHDIPTRRIRRRFSDFCTFPWTNSMADVSSAGLKSFTMRRSSHLC